MATTCIYDRDARCYGGCRTCPRARAEEAEEQYELMEDYEEEEEEEE